MNWHFSDQHSAGKFPNVKISILTSGKKNIFIPWDQHKGNHIDRAYLIDWLLTIRTPNTDESFVIVWRDELVCVGVIGYSLSDCGLCVVFCYDWGSLRVKKEDLFRLFGRNKKQLFWGDY